MTQGIIYCMTTIVPGLIKIGSTKDQSEYKNRMYHLEHNGYCNVTGLKKYYAVEVEDYKEQEQEMFETYKSGRVGNTELFAAEIGVVAKHMSRLKGRKIYPEDIEEKEIIKEAEDSIGVNKIDDGLYYTSNKPKGQNITYRATMRVQDGVLYLCEGSDMVPGDVSKIPTKKYKQKRIAAPIDSNNRLIRDIICDSPSEAGSVFKCNASNGWIEWKTKDGKKIDIYRNKH